MPANESRPALLVNREHFLEGLRLVLKVKGLGSKPASFGFADGQLIVRFGDYSFRADAEGTWPGQVMIKGVLLRGLAKSPPPGGEKLFVFYEGGALHLYRSRKDTAGRSLDATWEKG